MTPESQHNYFDLAYRTGSDIWTHIPYQKIALRMMPQLAPDTIILDVGSGRGVWAFALIGLGYRVIGIDYVRSIVDSVNNDIKLHNDASKARFIHGTATDLPFTDASFTMATDIGLLQHLSLDDRAVYVRELARVTAPGGHVLLVTLSSETPRYLGFTPKTENKSPYEKFNVLYSFFSASQISELFGQAGFATVAQQVEFFDTRTDPGDSLGLLFTLIQKK